MLRHQHAQCCAAAELEICVAKKEAAVADAAIAAVAKVGLHPVGNKQKLAKVQHLIEKCQTQQMSVHQVYSRCCKCTRR